MFFSSQILSACHRTGTSTQSNLSKDKTMATISAPIPIAQTAASKFASEELAKLATPPPSPPVFSAVNGALTTTGEDEMSITEKLEKLGVKWVRIGMLNVK